MDFKIVTILNSLDLSENYYREFFINETIAK
jgi:hypothetical protein